MGRHVRGLCRVPEVPYQTISLWGMTKRKKKKQQQKPGLSRGMILHEATHAVTAARNVSYGEPLDDFACTSEFWDSYIARITQVRGYPDILPHDVPVMMVLLKISRLAQTPGDADHWVDIAGYSAIGGEIASQLNCCE